jgi:predicted aconitase
MELMCALIGKAPYFGLMTDEGRMATWLIDVKTTKEPDWGVLGAAIGIKVVEDVSFIVGIDQYFEGGITGENLHKLKAMGASTAANPTSSVIDVSRCFSTREPRKSSLHLRRFQGSRQFQSEPMEQDRLMLVGSAHATTAKVDRFRGGKDDVHHS